MQESIYGQGAAPSGWAADRALADLPEFAEDADPLLLTGEMIYPWMFRRDRGPAPLRGRRRPAGRPRRLAAAVRPGPPRRQPGPARRGRLPRRHVRGRRLSLRTAREVGGTRVWVTNEWEHDGVTASGGRVLARLMDLAADRA